MRQQRGTLTEPIANGTRQTTEFVTTRVEDAKLTYATATLDVVKKPAGN